MAQYKRQIDSIRLRRQNTFIVSESTSHCTNANYLSSDEDKVIETTSNPEYVLNKEHGHSTFSEDDMSDVSDLSDATYVKEDKNEVEVKKASRSEERKPNPILKRKNPEISPIRPRSCNGILDPSDYDKRKAQWLSYGSPSFTSSRRRGSYDQRIAKSISKEEGKKDKKANLACFKRSLKLLGIHPEDFDEFRQDEKKNSEFLNPRSTPTFSTQLKRRSVSLTSLRTAVQEARVPSEEAIDHLQREILSKAVYEEWYFKKLAEDRLKREMKEKHERKKQDEMEKAKAEQRQKAEDYYNKWKQMKSESRKKDSKVLTKPRSHRDMPAYSVSQTKADEAFHMWKTEKDRALQMKVGAKNQKEKQEREKKDKEEKRSSAEAAYRLWKQQFEEDLRAKTRERERKTKEAEEKKKKEMQEKKENARTSFNAWKKMKDSEVKQKLRNARLAAERASNAGTMVQAEKVYEAEQAFEEWMDQVEERQRAQKMAALRRRDKQNPPPWSPGGSFCR